MSSNPYVYSYSYVFDANFLFGKFAGCFLQFFYNQDCDNITTEHNSAFLHVLVKCYWLITV